MFITDIDDKQLDVVNVSKSERFITQGSKGMQPKWRHDNRIVKLNSLGYEDIAEVLVSRFLQFTDISSEDYILYYPCSIVEDGVRLGTGCYSENFMISGVEVKVSDLLIKGGKSFSISYENLRDYLFSLVGFDVKSYIDKLLCLDSITRNEDRHFGNIVFIRDEKTYRPAPIFDNGASCMSDLLSYPIDCDFDIAYKSILAKPFNTDFKSNLKFNKKILVDYNGFINSVSFSDKYSRRAFEVIKRGLEEMRGIAWEIR